MTARVSQTLIEAQSGGNPAARVSQVLVETQTGGNPAARISQALVEAQTGGNPTIRIAQALVEVIMLAPREAPNVSTIPLPIGGGPAGARTPLPGLAWSAHLRPQWSTRVSPHTSGREVRAALQQYPRYEIELSFEVLRATAARQEFQTLLGFFLARQGRFDSFLLDLGAITHNAGDNSVVAQPLGVADGGTTGFTLLRATGGFFEPVGYVFPGDLAGVFVNGKLADPASYTFTPPAALVFASAPPAGAVITASYFYYFCVRFSDDIVDFEAFARDFWDLQSLKLQTVLP